MGAAGHGLRALRLVLLGGALAVLWMALTAVNASAAPRQGDRSLPVLSDAPLVRDVVGDTPASPRAPSAAEPSDVNRKGLPRKPVRSIATSVEGAVSAPVSGAVPRVVAVTDTTVQAVEKLASDTVEVVASTADALPVVPVAPVLDPVVDVVEAVVEEVPLPSRVVAPPAPPPGDTAPPAVTDETTGEVRAKPATSADESPQRAVAAPRAAAPTGPGRATAAEPSLTVAPESSTDATSQRAVRGSQRSSLPLVPAPLGPVSGGCVPAATSSGGGPLDHAADRVAPLVQEPAEVPTCTAGHLSMLTGPTALPGFSPE
jgi:hypothetical protein